MAENKDSLPQYVWTHTCGWCKKTWTTQELTPQTELHSHGICLDCRKKAKDNTSWKGEKN